MYWIFFSNGLKFNYKLINKVFMNYNKKHLFIYVVVFGFVATSSHIAFADNSTTSKITGTVSKEIIDTKVDSLVIKQLNQQLKLDDKIFNDLNKNLLNVDLLQVKPTAKKDEQKVENNIENNVEENDNSYSKQYESRVHNISFGDLHNDSRVESNNINVNLNNNEEVKINNKEFISNIRKEIQEGNIKEAEENLDKAYNSINSDPWALAEVASIYDSIGKNEKAISSYQKAVKLLPNRIEILYNYALSLYKGNDLYKASSYLKKIVEINPDFTLAYYNLGNIYYKEQNYNMALKSFSKVTEINPMCADAYFNIAIILESLNHKALALKYYTKYAQLEPTDTSVNAAIKRLKS